MTDQELYELADRELRTGAHHRHRTYGALSCHRQASPAR